MRDTHEVGEDEVKLKGDIMDNHDPFSEWEDKTINISGLWDIPTHIKRDVFIYPDPSRCSKCKRRCRTKSKWARKFHQFLYSHPTALIIYNADSKDILRNSKR